MNKILFVSNTANFSKFNAPYMRWFLEQNWEVHYASKNEEQIPFSTKTFSIPISRSPFSINNIISIFSLSKIIKNEKYKIMHCHTPMGSVVARIAAIISGDKEIKVIYTAHGFHFYKGSSIISWLIYYPIEKILSKYTDILILINNEDYKLAKKNNFKAHEILKLNGVGVDVNKFKTDIMNADLEKKILREKYNYNEKDFIILYVAEFITRKNHRVLINQLPKLRLLIPKLKVIFCGNGILQDKMKELVILKGVESIVNFVGYRQDVNMFCKISDIHVSVSKQEGLSFNNIEAMASGLPIICSRIRGHIDVITDGENGFLFDLKDEKQIVNLIYSIYSNISLFSKIRINNIKKSEEFNIATILDEMSRIYLKLM